jgi:hypothetical protein
VLGIVQRLVTASIASCAVGTDAACVDQNMALRACTPCYCLGLSGVDSLVRPTAWASAAKDQCAAYVDSWDLKRWYAVVSCV